MADKKIQKMRYSDEELSIIKNTFADNGELLFALRKHFLQLPKDVIDNQLLESLKDKAELLRLIRKHFFLHWMLKHQSIK